SQLVASIRDTVPSYETAGSLFDELRDYVKRRGAGGTLGAVWHNCAASGKEIDCEAVVLLNKPLTANRRIRVYELPAATVASAVHHGDLDFSNSYLNANKWIASNDLRRNGPNREIYLQGGYSDSDSAVMEIQFPVEPARPPKSG
ncbi:MAG: GyrI-like domain-containing protein, partial [Blastocatellia bacterium]